MRLDSRFVAMLMMLMCAPPAFSQDKGMSQKDSELYAKMIFSEDIADGKLTQQKAGAYFKCANERYAKKLASNTQLAATLSDATNALMNHSGKLTQAQREEHERKYGPAFKEASKLQQAEEDYCRKELGIDPTVKRIFNGFGSK